MGQCPDKLGLISRWVGLFALTWSEFDGKRVSSSEDRVTYG